MLSTAVAYLADQVAAGVTVKGFCDLLEPWRIEAWAAHRATVRSASTVVNERARLRRLHRVATGSEPPRRPRAHQPVGVLTREDLDRLARLRDPAVEALLAVRDRWGDIRSAVTAEVWAAARRAARRAGVTLDAGSLAATWLAEAVTNPQAPPVIWLTGRWGRRVIDAAIEAAVAPTDEDLRVLRGQPSVTGQAA